MPYRVEITIHHDVIRDHDRHGVSSGLLFETTGLLQETVHDVQRRWLEGLRQEPWVTAEIKERTHNFNYLSNPITFSFEEAERGSLRAKLVAGVLAGAATLGGAAAQDTIKDTETYIVVKQYAVKSLDSYTQDFRKTLQKKIEEMNAKENPVGVYDLELLDQVIKVSVKPKQMKNIESLASIGIAA